MEHSNPERGQNENLETQQESAEFNNKSSSIEDLPDRKARIIHQDGRFGIFYGPAQEPVIKGGTRGEAREFLSQRKFADPDAILDRAESSDGRIEITLHESHSLDSQDK